MQLHDLKCETQLMPIKSFSAGRLTVTIANIGLILSLTGGAA